MLFNNQDFNVDQTSTITGNDNYVDQDMNVDINVGVGGQFNPMMGNPMMGSPINSCPIMEPLQERCVHRTFCHQIQHVCPIRTRIINHHIFKHCYRPEFSCCEQNVVSNIDQGSCCNFR